MFYKDADCTGLLTFKYVGGIVCHVDLTKCQSTTLLALVVARHIDRGKGLGDGAGGRTSDKLAEIYGLMPGALFGALKPSAVPGYKASLQGEIENGIRKAAKENGVELEQPGLIEQPGYGRGYRLRMDIEVRGIDLDDFSDRVRRALE